MRHFFITGLPRSRTAWLANLLTTGDTFCHHESIARKEGPKDLTYLNGDGYSAVGDSGAALLMHWRALNDRFPKSKWVVVHRDAAEATESASKAFPELGSSDLNLHASEIRDLVAHLDEMRFGDIYEVTYQELDDPDACASLFRFCTGKDPDMQRIKLLQSLNVQVHATKAAQSLPAPIKAAAARAYKQPFTPKSAEYQAILQELCASCPEAYEWLLAVLDLAMTWDHLVDGDCIDNEVAERAFEAVLFRWPHNAFWQRYAGALTPVLSNAVAAWKSGTRIKEYDLYSELPCTVAYLLGGRPMVEHWSPRIRKLTAELMAEDNQLDNQ